MEDRGGKRSSARFDPNGAAAAVALEELRLLAAKDGNSNAATLAALPSRPCSRAGCPPTRWWPVTIKRRRMRPRKIRSTRPGAPVACRSERRKGLREGGGQDPGLGGSVSKRFRARGGVEAPGSARDHRPMFRPATNCRPMPPSSVTGRPRKSTWSKPRRTASSTSQKT